MEIQENICSIGNLEAEQSILGSILLDKSCIEHIESLVSNDFSKEYNRIIFESMMDLNEKNKPIDLITLTNELKSKGLLEHVGGVSYITSLSTIVPTTSNIKHYVDIVKVLSDKRKVIKASYGLIENIRSGKDIDSSMVVFEKECVIDNTAYNEADSIVEVLSELFDDMQEKPEEKIKTGISIIDKCTNGLGRHELITIGAGSGVGKSAIALKIAINAYEQEKKVLIFSREMSKKQIAKRILLSRTGISKNKFENREFTDMDWKRTIDVINSFYKRNMILDDKSSTIQMFKNKMRKERPDLVIVDYTQLVTPSNTRESRERQVAEISRELQQMARDFDTTIIQLSQLAEKGSGNFRPTGESYTRESRAIYHDSHIVIYMHRVTEEKELEKAYKSIPAFHERGSFEDIKATIEARANSGIRFVEINVDKNRDGEPGSNFYWFKGSDLDYYSII
ncbi:MAG: DnaB-like helicase C-terminal domain-containing protein [Romboutsia timonensis]|uniref:replicative DNA helicase n=1 Tax=Romboutsia timonensis TaxID=1776391 RepID=UPI002A75E409|nr:DnaB-like helicase C-terminal domain-containing protein [Romboutsia timonensis]MDY3001915.1 DnaB-like helicase C-terminal domain-containing protein [Romboutsia timonensis]